MSNSLRITEGEGFSLEEAQDSVCQPIEPSQSHKEVELATPSGVYRVSARAIRQINRVESRAGRVFATAARFAFRS